MEEDSYKPLIYILPNEAFSTPEVVTAVEEKVEPSSITKKDKSLDVDAAVKAATPVLVTVLSLVGSPFLTPVATSLAAIALKLSWDGIQAIKNASSTDTVEASKALEIAKALDEVNLAEWSSFVDQIPFGAIPAKLSFPPGHPLPNRLYRVHPLKNKRKQYIPIELFDSLLYAEREAELIRLLVDLGATKITIQEISTQTGESGMNADVGVTGVGGIQGELKGNRSQSDVETRTLKLRGKQWTAELTIDRDSYSWLPYEPSWDYIVHARLYGGCLEASVELTTDSSYSIAGQLNLAEGILKNIGALEGGISISQSRQKKKVFSFEFADAKDS